MVGRDGEPQGESPLPQTAQVAAQQGAFVGHLLNRKYNVSSSSVPSHPEDLWWRDPKQFLFTRCQLEARPFAFLNFGILASIGGDEAVAQVKLGQSELFQSSGQRAFLLWRSVYLVKQVN